MHTGFIHLETARLIIRDHLPVDLASHHALLCDAKTMYYQQDIRTETLEQSKANLEVAIAEITRPNRSKYFLRMEDKSTREHIGEIGYTVKSVPPAEKVVGLGYFIRPQYWGKGYTTEAAKEILRFAFNEDDVFCVTTGCLKENIGSERVMQKCGMVQDADVSLMEWHDGKMKDRVCYRINRNDWQTKAK